MSVGFDATTVSHVPSDAEIRQLLVKRIDEDRESVGIVIGVIDPTGRRIVSYGHLEKGDKRPLDGNTPFEIGSITKVFTALLDDPIAKYLPPTVTVPARDDRQITLVDLATHTSIS
jgi:CubicO group peptidase (beta-lactamase class C family)